MPPLRPMVAGLRTRLDNWSEVMRVCREHEERARQDRIWCLTNADSLRIRGLQATADFVQLTADNVRAWGLSHAAAHDFVRAQLLDVERVVFMLEAIIRYEQEVWDMDMVRCGWAYHTLDYINPMVGRINVIHDAYDDIEERVEFCRQLEAEAPDLFPPLQPLIEIIDLEYVTREQLEPEAECPICLEEYTAANDIDAAIVRLPCEGRHTFHAACIGAWLDRREEQGEDVSCPLDRELLL